LDFFNGLAGLQNFEFERRGADNQDGEIDYKSSPSGFLLCLCCFVRLYCLWHCLAFLIHACENSPNFFD
jgi:hypothetical protein